MKVSKKMDLGRDPIYLFGLKDTFDFLSAFNRVSRALSWSEGTSSIAGAWRRRLFVALVIL